MIHRPYLPWVVLFAPALALSALAMSQLAQVPDRVWLILPTTLLLVAGLLRWRTRWRVLAWLMMGIAVGMAGMHLKMLDWQNNRIADLWFGQTIAAEVMIDGIAKPVTGGWQCEIRTLSTPSPSLTGRSLLSYWTGDVAPIAGQIWSVTLRLSPNQGWRNPGGFDYQQHLFSRGIHAQAQILSATPKTQRWHWQAWRWHIFSHLQHTLPNSEFTGLNLALIMGESLLISQEQWQVLRETGTLHLAVVSGMHLTLVGSLAGLIALSLWRYLPSERFHAQWVAAWVAWLTATAFAVLAGLNLPVQRAWLMISVVLIAVLLKRELHPLLLLSWALLLVMLWDIGSVMQAGFWLSFVATAALIWLLTAPEGWWWKLLALHLGMSFLLAPLLIIFFQQIPLYAPLANLIAAPVVEWLLIPLLLLAGLLSPILPDLTHLIGQGVDAIWSILWPLLTQITTLPHAILLVNMSGWHWGMIMLWLLLIILWRSWLLKPIGILLLAIPSLMIPLLPATSDTPSETRLILLDTGKKLPVIIWQHQQENWLFGVGDRFGRQHLMDMTILPALTALNIHQLTGVWLWQEDKIADQQGLSALQRYLPVKSVYSYDPTCRPQGQWQWQKAGDHCWLGVSLPQRRVWMTPHPPTQLPKSLAKQDVILSPNPKNLSQRKLPVDLWLSHGNPIPKSWAAHIADTASKGALFLNFRDNQLILDTQAAREGRFYHP